MDLIAQYNSDSEEEHKAPIPPKGVCSNPKVDVDLARDPGFRDPQAKTLYHNPTFEQMYTPMQGPELPGSKSLTKTPRNTLTGHFEAHAVDDFHFDEQYHTFQSFGYAADPSQSRIPKPGEDFIGDSSKYIENQGATVFRQTNSQKQLRNKFKRRRNGQGDPSDIDNYQGPWAKPIEDEEKAKELEADQKQRRKQFEEDQKRKKDEEEAAKKARRKEVDPDSDSDEDSDDAADDDDLTGPQGLDRAGTTVGEKRRKKNLPDSKAETTVFEYGDEEMDYQGRTYMHCPAEFRPKGDRHPCYIPKQWVHTWTGHSKGVSAIRWLPKTGHILLSSSLDSTLKIWNVNTHRQCLRTISGHLMGVRDISFNNEGDQFLSVSYDRWIKLWDTETGKLVSKFSSGKIPYSARYHPGNENEFLVGQKDKMVVGWDRRQNAIIQRYEEHLSAVNTVTFVDENRRFVSTSDDKKIFVWEYGIPVVIKHISEPDMHSVPFVTPSPDNKWVLGTSLDNQIVVYSAQGRFRQNRKKTFKGHNVAGYACGIDMSPNLQFVVSGDAEGRVFFWDWKSCKIYKRLKAHDKVTIDCKWHPVHPSKVATCSWDGTIKYWD